MCGNSPSSMGMAGLCLDSHRQTDTQTGPWGQSRLCEDIAVPWGRSQLRGEGPSSVGWSQIHGDGQSSVGTVPAPQGWHRSLALPWALLLSPCPFCALGGSGALCGCQGRTPGQVQAGMGTLGASPHLLGPLRTLRYLGWNHHTKTWSSSRGSTTPWGRKSQPPPIPASPTARLCPLCRTVPHLTGTCARRVTPVLPQPRLSLGLLPGMASPGNR